MEQKAEIKKLPDEYINTTKGIVLAVIKLLEALVCGYALYYIFSTPQAVRRIMNDLFTNLEVNSSSAFASTYQLLNDSVQYILGFVLMLIALDGIGGFLLRTIHKGAGLVRFCHLVRYIFSVAGLVVSIVIYVQYIMSLVKVTQTIRQFKKGDCFAFLGSFELIIDAIILLGVFWIFVTYDRYVAKLMKHVKAETKVGKILPYNKKNHLGREAAWLGSVLGVSAILAMIELIAGDSVISFIAGFIRPVGMLRGTNVISVVITAVLAVKFLLVNRCSADFDKAH